MTTRFIKAVSEGVDDLLDITCSVVEVTHWIVERLMYAKTPKAENLAKEPYNNIKNTSSQNYVDTDLTQDLVDTEFEVAEGKVDNYYTETTITGNSDSEEEVRIQNIEEGQVLEEFMLEEIEFQDIDKCKIVELPR